MDLKSRFNFKMTKSLLAVLGGIIGVIAFVAAYIAFSYTSFMPDSMIFWPHTVHHVVLRSDGFHPSQLTIREGDTLVFSTTLTRPYWPASNPHPVHTEYPAFDPRMPIAATSTWSYTFPDAGQYGFHDHLNAQFLGEVTVLRKDGSKVVADCTKDKTVQCYEQLMRDTVKNQGIAAALTLVQNLSQTEPGFVANCHGYVHILGEEAYYQYAEHKDFELSPATAVCGYGFYHGFMETLLQTTGDITEARDFCKYVSEKLAGKAADAGTACYHGTGHGAMDGSDPTLWGDANKMMAPALKLCGMLAENDFQLYLCTTGVFNATEILSQDPKYGLTDLRKDPFPFCNTQPLARLEPCYSNMLPAILDDTHNDFQKSIDYIDKNITHGDETAIDGNTIHQMVILGLMFEYIRIHGEEPNYAEVAIKFCQSQVSADRLACIMGLSGGHLKYGKADTEYTKMLEFCSNTMLTSDERDSCYKYSLPRLSGRYDQQKTTMICNQVPQEYREKYCPTF